MIRLTETDEQGNWALKGVALLAMKTPKSSL